MRYIYIFILFIYLYCYKYQTKFINKVFNYNITNGKGYSNIYSIFYDDLFFEEKKYNWEAGKVLQYKQNGRLLDVCCGTGIHYSLLSNNYTILGIDKSKYMIDRALEKNPNGNFLNEDINKFESFKKFDVITAFYDGIFYNENWKNILYKLKLLLKKNGYLFISFLDKNNLENAYLRMVYNNTILYYYGEWNKTEYNEKITNFKSNILFSNKHKLYLPTEKDFLEEMNSLTLVEKIRYDMFDAKDEILYIFKL